MNQWYYMLNQWLIGQGIVFAILMTFGFAVKLIVEIRTKTKIPFTRFFLPLILGFSFAAVVQYFILFGGK